MINRKRIGTMVFVVILSCIVAGWTALAIGGQNHTKGKEGIVSTLAGLKSENIQLLISTDREHAEHKEQLYQRVHQHFRAAGLKVNLNQKMLAHLKLTLKVRPIPGLPGKYLYVKMLALIEPVTLQRSELVSVQATTWSYGSPQPVITHRISREKLESDLDGLILQFIQSYKRANPDRSP